jgi:hypothetical protein
VSVRLEDLSIGIEDGHVLCSNRSPDYEEEAGKVGVARCSVKLDEDAQSLAVSSWS